MRRLCGRNFFGFAVLNSIPLSATHCCAASSIPSCLLPVRKKAKNGPHALQSADRYSERLSNFLVLPAEGAVDWIRSRFGSQEASASARHVRARVSIDRSSFTGGVAGRVSPSASPDPARALLIDSGSFPCERLLL